MARAVYRKNKDGKVTYVGHVPPEYQLKDNEFFKSCLMKGMIDEDTRRMLWL